MRDPNRIEPFLNTINKVWSKVPDWRFGQLIENLKRGLNISDLFFIEDNDLEDKILELFNEKEEK